MLKALLIVFAVVGLVAAGVVEGMRTNRWGNSGEIQSAAARFANVPPRLGHWQSADRVMDPAIQKIAGAAGYLDRMYTNAKTGESVDVLMLSGPTGPIAAHTPDICYAGIGYAMKDVSPVRRAVAADGTTFTYWSARFEKESSPNVPALLVCWAWGVDGDWSASDAPRRDYLTRQSLYKLYVTRTVPASDKDATRAAESVNDFLKEFLPTVKTALAAPPG